LSKVKTLKVRKVRGISPVEKEKVYGGKDLSKSQVFRMKERAACRSVLTAI